MTIKTKGMGAIIKGMGKGVKELAKPFIKEAVGLEQATKVFRGLKPELKGLTGFKKISKSKKPSPHTGGRTRKFGGGILKKIGKILSKKKPVKKDFKTDLSDYPTSKNIHKLIAKEPDPFVRKKLISIRDQAEKGTVIGKGGNVIQTPTKERTAKTLLERHPGSYQRKKPEGKK